MEPKRNQRSGRAERAESHHRLRIEKTFQDRCEIIIMETGCTKTEAWIALEENDNDTLKAIQMLKSL